MSFNYDATGVDASGGFPVIEDEGWFPFSIGVATEGKSKNGDYQVVVDTVCLNSKWKDYGVRHWVTFLPPGSPGAGMAIHFLKCIGQPYEGALNVDPMAWERKNFMARVIVNKYKDDNGNEKTNNKLAEIRAVDGQGTSVDNDDPFGA